MFQKQTLIIVTVVVALGLAFGTFFFRSNQQQDTKKVKANSGTASITTQGEWDAGEKNNIDSNSTPGSIKINTAGQSEIDLKALYDSGDLTLSATANNDQAPNIVDGNIGTAWHMGWGQEPCEPTTPSCKTETISVDLGSTFTISRIHLTYSAPPFEPFMINGAIPICTIEGPDCTLDPPVSFQTIDFARASGYNASYDFYIQELQMYTSGRATHTTGATQIDGGANFWQWESFTDSKTTPANTSVTYRYRTSADGLTWNAWHDSIGAVESRSGDDSNNPTKYRYLQLEATLSNTDGASTPTIDSYTIGYHTNQRPNAPTAMTAVIN